MAPDTTSHRGDGALPEPHGAGWALAPGRFVVLVAGFAVAAVATELTLVQLGLSAAGLVWVAASAVAVRSSGRIGRDCPGPGDGCPLIPTVDAVFVVAVIAVTGGAESPLRWLAVAAPAIWAAARQPHLLALGAFGAVGYLVAASSDLLRGDGGTLRTVVEFLAIYGGATVAAEATARSHRRESALQAVVAADRRDAELRLLAQAREQREQLVLQLHDGPLQLVLAAKQDLEEGAGGHPVDLDGVGRDLAEAVEGMRTLSSALYRSVLDDADLAGALHRVADVVEGRGGPPVRVSVGAGCAGVHDALVLRTVNELLTNVEKHARAEAAVVTLQARTSPDQLQLIVSDDGVGIAEDLVERARATGHLGLASIDHAIGAVGGTLQARRAARGTEVHVLLPFDRTGPLRQAGPGHR